jgi:putative DNA primase/helicase
MTPVEQALAYAKRWPAFPTALVPRANGKTDKVPLVKWAKAAADRAAVDARDPVIIRCWWRRWPDAVISMPTGQRSGAVILDIDVKDGVSGFDTLADLDVGLAALPETWVTHTPSGGVHVWFSVHPEVEIRNSQGGKGLGVGLDVRGEGGQVVLPGPGGYWWDPHLNPETVPLLAAPPWLGHRETRKAPIGRPGVRLDPEAILREACDNIRGARQGERHEVLNREAYLIACLVSRGELSQSTALHQLEAATLAMAAATAGDRGKAARDLADAFADGRRAGR